MNYPGRQVPNILLEISGAITPERMKGWSQSKNNIQLWMGLEIEARSDAVKSNIAKEPGMFSSVSLVQSLSRVRIFLTPWTAARQASLSITNSRSPPKPMSIESVMPSNHLILCHPLLLLPSNFPSIRVFSNESVLRIRWPKDWSFSFSISPSNQRSGLICFGWTGWISLQSKGLSRVFSNTTVQKHQFFGAQLSLQSNSHIHT